MEYAMSLIVLLALAGREIHVSPLGSDANPGSAQAPLRSIQRAAAMAGPDTTVHVAPGIYREHVTSNASGAPRAPLRFVSSAKWGARLVGDGEGAIWTNNGSHVEIVGFDLSGRGRIGILNRGSHTRIEGNHVHDLLIAGGCGGDGGAGITNANYAATHGAIVGNVVHDIGVPGTCNGVQGIYVSNRRALIQNNLVYRAAAFGIHLWHAAGDVLIANNTVFANGSARMGGGIVVGAGDGPGGVLLERTVVVNNIVYDNPGASIVQYCDAGQDCIGRHNVIANNLLYANGRSVQMRVGKASGTIAADPQFVDYRADGSGDYRLRRGSPGVDRAAPAHAPSMDIDAVARPRGTAPDIGADENY